MYFRQVTDERLAQYAYLVGCQRTGEALVIDPERDIDRYVEMAESEGLRVTAVTETHIHADFLSGSREFADRYGVTVYLSDEGGEGWQYGWADDPGKDIRLVTDGDTFMVGNIEIRVVHTPGHTPEHVAFMITDRGGGADEPMGMVSGDFVFVGDLGRPDLLETAAGQVGAMEPAARRLYSSAQSFLSLPDYLQVWPGHGAGSACGKALGAVPDSTVGYERRFSPALHHVQAGESDFVSFILDGQPEPPTYFARMKKWNRDGPPLLGQLPSPKEISASDLERVISQPDTVVVDTRADRRAFMASHLPGSLYAPLDKAFPTVVGSYVEPEQTIVLVAEPQDVSEAVESLVRIGLDRFAAWIRPSALASATEMASTPVVTMADVARHGSDPDAVVLDVRGVVEFDQSHVPGALNVAHTRLAARLDDVPMDKLVYAYCRTGARAAGAASFLERSGRKVAYVDDLFANWAPESSGASA